jgi:hypothetical protein
MTLPAVRTLVVFMRAIAVLALPAPAQMEWLRSLGLPGEPAVSDEIAQEFDDGYRLLPVFIERGWLPERMLPPLADLNDLLTRMSGAGHSAVWETEALASATEWEQARTIARTALKLL